MDFMSGLFFGFGALFGIIGAIIVLCISIRLLSCVFGLIMGVALIVFMPFWSMYCFFLRGDKYNEDNMTEFYTVGAITAFILFYVYEYFSIACQKFGELFTCIGFETLLPLSVLGIFLLICYGMWTMKYEVETIDIDGEIQIKNIEYSKFTFCEFLDIDWNKK